MSPKTKDLLKRIIISIIGTFMIAVTIGIMRILALGVDPFTSLIIGICNMTNTPFRIVYPIINGLILIFIFFLNRSMIGWGTLINLILIGPVADYSANIFENIYTNPTFASKVVILILATIVMAMNVSLYASTNIGVSAYDSLFITINKRKPNMSLGKARILTDTISVIVGFIGKAALGIGTILNVLIMGPLVEFFTKTTTKAILKTLDVKAADIE